ncbi:type II toxin-antitoxin system RelE/ParE family toxin [Ancylobacter sp. 6x-1]|uniref:Type II toxin-antitoxin system RelE/ParE family toxin n=1 Tax=Ancylobacter crimeensis TaxID=2579147 RepID=A0ABT0DG81_9HYPH|nr:type II toxin-antitoxin system RelE/ParE family toxin [Ancylobacter crimeensis]MCK0198973.1 type II toxin-antitoxin system RelE/ParE family toxin [Ancylobacter crimeensis]
MKEITFSKDAARTLRKMPRNIALLIRAKLDQYASDPSSLANNVTAIKSEPGYFRLRVLDWRVVFSEDGFVISVIRIAPRGSVYD